MRVFVVVAAMLFCMPVFAQGVNSFIKGIDMELIEIPAGKFTMGSPEDDCDEVQVSVTLTKAFGLGKYEVTRGQWKKVMGSTPWAQGQPTTIKGEIKGENVAATYVSYFDAVEFCDLLTDLEHKSGKLKADEEYRLPTEAEWEYACRAGTTTAFSFGDDESKLGEYAWFEDDPENDGEEYAHKVGLKKPNPWGLHDMHGNVFEWCSDWYGEALSGGIDPVGPGGGSFRVIRGGCWRGSPGLCRSANRIFLDPSNRIDYLGFRVARSQSVK